MPSSIDASIDERFRARHLRSAELHQDASRVFPSGITHDIRHFLPFPIYVERAVGARKWDVDGNELIDYVMGHGALLFGHAHPSLVEAVQQQVARGSHYGASHHGEIEWAQLVQSLIPSAEKVRFTSSGTEATMMAVRLARAATGRPRLLRFRNHFHGWADAVVVGARNTAGSLGQMGLPPAAAESVTVVDQHDTAAMDAALSTETCAAVICEPTGSSWGTSPLDPSVLAFLRERTKDTGTLLIFDEVVTGFRADPGGVQTLTQILPDITTLAKILAGGMPGGAVAGRADLLDRIAFSPEPADANAPRIAHPGTFNANPISAAAGIAALRSVVTGDPGRVAAARAAELCRGLNAAIREADIPGAAYTFASMLHIVLDESVPPPDDGITWSWGVAGPQGSVPSTPDAVRWPFRRSLMNHGIDLMGMGAMVSSVHTEADINQTIDAFSATLSDLRREEIL